MSDPYRRTMGLSVPITDALDPVAWRQRYAYGVVLGQGEPIAETDSVAQILGCDAGRGRAKTAAGRAVEAQSLITQAANDLPNDVIRWHLRAALSELEIKLGLPMGIVITKGDPVDPGLTLGVDYDKTEPRRVFLDSERRDYYRIDLPAGVISVERVRAYWFGQPVWSISATDSNLGLLRLEHPGTSSLHILPTQAATLLVAMPTLSTPAYGAMQMISGYPSPLPDVWSVDYTMGPRTRFGEIGQIEAALVHWVYCKAGIVLLSVGGMASSRGLTSASLSIDGLNKSIGLQASAMYGINSALETRLKEAAEALDIKALRAYKRGLRVRPYGS